MDAVEFLRLPHSNTWHEHAEHFLDDFIRKRYGQQGRKAIALRCPKIGLDDGAFAAVLHKDAPSSGGYGGTSFVMFPSETDSVLISLVVGTQGLAPDEHILTRPGHARTSRAFASWARLDLKMPKAWAKSDPTRIDVLVPNEVASNFSSHSSALSRYGSVAYLMVDPSSCSDTAVSQAFTALLDLYMEERGVPALTAFKTEAQSLRSRYEERIFSREDEGGIDQLLRTRKFVIVQGPPGTGKTRLGLRLLKNQFGGNGMVVQFHPSVSYEQFVGGLAPTEKGGAFGFEPRAGWLMQAANAASKANGKPFLLLIDEINRADLAKVLGEAINLFEPRDSDRSIGLPYDFGPPWHAHLNIPSNLSVLGTMNSADRSIAILDLAIRRRFAFVSLWPEQNAIADQHSLAKEAFQALRKIFVSQASTEQLELLPGHAYFLARDEADAKARLRTELMPLLQDYLHQGLIAGFSEDIEGYLQWLDARVN